MRWMALILCTFVMFLLTGCTALQNECPVGTWVSLDPDIRFTIEREDICAGMGLYTRNGEEIEIKICKMTIGQELSIYRAVYVDEPDPFFRDMGLFHGTYTIKEGQLMLKLKPKWREVTGYDEIIFERVDDSQNADKIKECGCED